MSTSHRSIIFARIPEFFPLPAAFKNRPYSRIIVNHEATGWIVIESGLFSYRLADGTLSGLPLTTDRGDLERQILLFHLGPLAVDQTGPEELFRAAS